MLIVKSNLLRWSVHLARQTNQQKEGNFQCVLAFCLEKQSYYFFYLLVSAFHCINASADIAIMDLMMFDM
jgi:hypothetical protein